MVEEIGQRAFKEKVIMKLVQVKLSTKLFLVLLFIMILVPVSEVLAGEDIAKSKWIRVNSKNFEIVSNVSEKETKVLALKLEQFRYVISSIFGVEKAKAIPVTVYVFKDSISFNPFKVRYQGKAASVSGYFVNGADEKIIALEIENNDLSAIFHEYSHLVASLTNHRFPLWVAEGLADFYSTFQIKKDKEVVFGYGIKEYIYLLRNKPLIPLQDLFKVTHSSPYYNEKDKNNIFYAQSWALIHYLSQGPRQKQYVQFVYSLLKGIDVDEAFNTTFNTDYTTLEKELKTYIGQNESPIATYNFASLNFEKDTTVETLSEIEVKNYLGKLLLNVGISIEAEQYFRDVINAEPLNPSPYLGLGRLAIEDKNYPEAKKVLEKAISLGAKGGYVHYLYASAIYREILGDEISLVISDQNKLKEFSQVEQKVVKELNTAIELSPDFYRSYYLLGIISLVGDEELNEGFKSVTAARRLDPQNNNLVFLQAVILAKMKNYQDAKQVLNPLLSEKIDKNIRMQAQRVMEQVEQMQSKGNSGINGTANNSVSSLIASETPKILSKTNPKYSDEARRKSIEGMVVLSVVFAKDGVIKDIMVVKGLGHGLDEEAIKVAQEIKFVPGKKDGEPVSVKARLEYSFKLSNDLVLEFWQNEVVIKRGESKKVGIRLNRNKNIKGAISVSLAEGIEGIELAQALTTNEEDDVLELRVSDKANVGKSKLVFVAKDETQKVSSLAELILIIE